MYINYDMTDVILIKERALCDNYIDTSRLGYGVYVTGSWVEWIGFLENIKMIRSWIVIQMNIAWFLILVFLYFLNSFLVNLKVVIS